MKKHMEKQPQSLNLSVPPAPLTNGHETKSSSASGDEARFEELRHKIDEADAALLDALNRRAAVSLEVGRFKAALGAPVFRPEREAALLDKLTRTNAGPLPTDHLLAIYREILSSSRALQRPLRVAYLGPEGTFSHMAVLEYLGESHTFVPMTSLAAVFDAVVKQECDLGAVPVENSLGGSVGQTLDSFHGHDVHVLAEWFSRIRLSLLSRESAPEKINTVYSHPQALNQCAGWLRDNLPGAEQVSLPSTAAAAKRIGTGRGGEADSAAVGDARLAGRFGLHVLARNIEDAPDNWTRFFVIASSPHRDEAGDAAEKSSIMFSVRDTPGSLSKVLDTLAAAGVNMSKLESRPLRGERWKYVFFADLDCDITDDAHAPALEAAATHCLWARVLGAYPAGRHIHAVE